MNVYFDSGFWHNGKGVRGRRQAAGWRFEYGGLRCVIPAVYRFPQGIVFDILSFADEAALREYFTRYENNEALTPEIRRYAMQEHPFQPIPIWEIWLNGSLALSGSSYHHAICVPWMEQNESLRPLRRAYRRYINDKQSFACQRVRADYPNTDSRAEALLRRLRLNRIKSIRFTASDMKQYPFDIRFELPESAETIVEILNPATKQTHMLYFREAETTELPVIPGISRRLYATLATYEIDPELPEGASLMFNNSVPTGSVADNASADTESCGAAAACIIGGADGPTAIFVGTKKARRPKGPHGLPLHTCYSIPAFESKPRTFLLEGLSITHTGEAITLGDK